MNLSSHRSIERSCLFVPGSRPERFGKACAAGADRIIVDLEDAVAPAEKPGARAAIAAWLASAHSVWIRINGAATEWFQEDVELCRLPGVAGVVLAKAERVEDIQHIARRLAAGTAILPLIESAIGFSNALKLARAERVSRLIFGTIDFQADLGISGEAEELGHFRSQLVLWSRLAGLAPPVDGVSTALHDHGTIEAEARRARQFGFGGKLCVHPEQVEIVNRCFDPTDREIAWARRVAAAGETMQGAAVAVDGCMVDRAVLARAHAILARGAQRAQRGSRAPNEEQ